jgi:hypothetical protein
MVAGVAMLSGVETRRATMEEEIRGYRLHLIREHGRDSGECACHPDPEDMPAGWRPTWGTMPVRVMDRTGPARDALDRN